MGFFTLFGLSVAAFAASSWLWLSLLLMLPVGVGALRSDGGASHGAAAYSEDEMRGRVQALNAMMGGLIPLAVLGITGLAEVFGGRAALGAAGGVIAAYGVWEALGRQDAPRAAVRERGVGTPAARSDAAPGCCGCGKVAAR